MISSGHMAKGGTAYWHAAEPLPPTVSTDTTYVFFNAEEAAFIESAVLRLLPVDDEWADVFETGVPNYIDRLLAGPWGSGDLYRNGPWQLDTPRPCHRLPLAPAELFRTAIAAINNELKARTPFAKMAAEEQNAYLKSLETGRRDLGGVPSKVFFAMLWDRAMEGFFSESAARLSAAQACRSPGI